MEKKYEIAGLELLLAEEETCRRHIDALRLEVALKASAYIYAKRAGNLKAAGIADAEMRASKAHLTERIGHYATHSGNLVSALEADVSFLESENIMPGMAYETKNLLKTARSWSGYVKGLMPKEQEGMNV